MFARMLLSVVLVPRIIIAVPLFMRRPKEMMLQQVLQSIAVGDARGHAQPLALEPESGCAVWQGLAILF